MTPQPDSKNGHSGDSQVYETIAHLLRSETAQTLGYVVIQLAALAEVESMPALQKQILEVRAEVRDELRRILALIDDLETASRSA